MSEERQRVEVLAEVAAVIERLRIENPMNGDGSNAMLDRALRAIDRLGGHAPYITAAVQIVRNERAERDEEFRRRLDAENAARRAPR